MFSGSIFYREAIPIMDKEGRVIGVLAGQPDDPGWDEVHQSTTDLLDASHGKMKQGTHRRGRYPILSSRISFGGGQTFPQNLHNEGPTAHILTTLINHIAFICLAGFASGVFAAWALSLFQYYAMHLKELLLNDDTLVLNFANSIFAACTFNFGPWTVCFEHMDLRNLPFGWCTITVLGHFNPQKGGHFILWDLKLVIEFPPGSTILIPSTVLRHSNTAISRKETRYLFTQYMAGGLFLWVDQGFQMSEEYWSRLDDGEHATAIRTREEQWEMGLALFSKLSVLKATKP
ncbi:hypothetical protein EDD85DRAFT_770799 [Armillaria nabsnona]|nr:hypothetical protein EDD85DRAFT_770799 [Armillaria nabsnona]